MKNIFKIFINSLFLINVIPLVGSIPCFIFNDPNYQFLNVFLIFHLIQFAGIIIIITILHCVREIETNFKLIKKKK